MKKPSLKIIKELEDGKYTDSKMFSWIISALSCLQYNMMVIYDLLPDKQEVKKIEPVQKFVTIKDGMTSATVDITPGNDHITFTPC